MIIAKIYGGLGNQMFQYAFGRFLSIKHKVPLKLDITALQKDLDPEFTKRNFQLSVFNINAGIATDNEINEFTGKSKIAKVTDLGALYIPIKNKIYLREPQFHFFAKALNAPSNAYIDGYWQSEKYFIEAREILLKEFSPKNKLSDKSQSLASQMLQENSVSVHVRRGDYVSIKQNQNIYETCSAAYYEKAITQIANDKNAKLYVFSDEPQWFAQNVKTDLPFTIVDHNTDDNSYEDLLLMSKCGHNIIANSSFSWWGAWLNANADKKVIAPKHWFKSRDKNTKDLICQSWIQL